jgi:ABC-type nitrate/sulfonate/bicarbonate transport system substrate-binding protein
VSNEKPWQAPVRRVLLIVLSKPLCAAERIYSAYFSPAPGASAVIWVAKQARLFEKHGLDVAPSEQRAHASAIIAGESAIAESAGPAAVSARLAGGDIVALAGSVNIHLLFRHAAEH